MLSQSWQISLVTRNINSKNFAVSFFFPPLLFLSLRTASPRHCPPTVNVLSHRSMKGGRDLLSKPPTYWRKWVTRAFHNMPVCNVAIDSISISSIANRPSHKRQFIVFLHSSIKLPLIYYSKILYRDFRVYNKILVARYLHI